MDKIFEAIISNDEERIVDAMQGLTDLSKESLNKLLKNCKSQTVTSLVKREFSKRIEAKKSNMTERNKHDIIAENLKNSKDSSANSNNKTSENLTKDSQEKSSFKGSSFSFETLTEKEAMKKYTFNNSKHDKALEMFLNAFKANVRNINYDRAFFLSKLIVEQLISEYSITFPKEVRSKSHNLKENEKLCIDVYDFLLETSDFVKLLPAEMQSEELKSKDSEYIKDSLLAAQVATATADTDMFQCGRCKQKKCTYSQLQTRSCDEPMTTFVTCTVCGHRWKF
ncbi:Transcription elongation factor A protein 1 [Glugoides intestinalis]